MRGRAGFSHAKTRSAAYVVLLTRGDGSEKPNRGCGSGTSGYWAVRLRILDLGGATPTLYALNFRSLLRFLARQRPSVIIAISVAILVAVVYVDWVTGPDFVMGEFYLLPVAMVTTLVGYRYGLLMAIVTVIVWGVAEVMGAAVYSHRAVAVLNGGVPLRYLGLIAWLLSVWRGIGGRVLAQVRERTAQLTAEVVERKQAEDALHRLTLKLSDA